MNTSTPSAPEYKLPPVLCEGHCFTKWNESTGASAHFGIYPVREIDRERVCMIDGHPCNIFKADYLYTGKHGGAKYWITGRGVFDGKKRRFLWKSWEFAWAAIDNTFHNVECYYIWQEDGSDDCQREGVAVVLSVKGPLRCDPIDEKSPLQGRVLRFSRGPNNAAATSASAVVAFSPATMVKRVKLTITVACGHFRVLSFEEVDGTTMNGSHMHTILFARWSAFAECDSS